VLTAWGRIHGRQAHYGHPTFRSKTEKENKLYPAFKDVACIVLLVRYIIICADILMCDEARKVGLMRSPCRAELVNL